MLRRIGYSKTRREVVGGLVERPPAWCVSPDEADVPSFAGGDSGIRQGQALCEELAKIPVQGHLLPIDLSDRRHPAIAQTSRHVERRAHAPRILHVSLKFFHAEIPCQRSPSGKRIAI